MPELPAYSPQTSSPPYSRTPLPTERTLQSSRRLGLSVPSSHDGVYIKSSGGTTLLLHDQESGLHGGVYAEHARFEANTPLRGSVNLRHSETTQSVVLKIEGRVETLPLPATYNSVTVLDFNQTLHSAESGPCPSELPFSYYIPSTFRDTDGKLYPLPPNFDIGFNPTQFARCTYHLTVTTVSARHRRASWLTKNDIITFEIRYQPRSSTLLPPLSRSISTVKASPEEWTQATKFTGDDKDGQEPICDLFLPSVGVFAAEEPIPFYLQLVPMAPGDSDSTVKVSITRQVEMDAGDRIARRCIQLGEATMVRRGRCLTWEGEARVQDPNSLCPVESFRCGAAMTITDMVAVEIRSPDHRRVFFGYPIRLTSERYER
ncbi:hypothetical protein C8F01DRAFT_1153332 [Mycena amicta]|nr:hypothetical protein C8F01DRAFT_1153332 [Mycena amicta]